MNASCACTALVTRCHCAHRGGSAMHSSQRLTNKPPLLCTARTQITSLHPFSCLPQSTLPMHCHIMGAVDAYMLCHHSQCTSALSHDGCSHCSAAAWHGMVHDWDQWDAVIALTSDNHMPLATCAVMLKGHADPPGHPAPLAQDQGSEGGRPSGGTGAAAPAHLSLCPV